MGLPAGQFGFLYQADGRFLVCVEKDFLIKKKAALLQTGCQTSNGLGHGRRGYRDQSVEKVKTNGSYIIHDQFSIKLDQKKQDPF
jgi:hypothetical protein